MSVYCSECDQRGHNRRNSKFHPVLKPLTSRQVYDRRYGLKKAVRGECRCGATITERNRRGEPRSLCRECLDRNAAAKRRAWEELRRLRAELAQLTEQRRRAA